MSPILDTIKQLIPDGDVFEKPMSKKARILLIDMLNWVNESNLKFGGFKPCFTEIVKLYDPLDFESWCHIYDMSKYIKRIPTPKKPKTKEDVIYWFEFMNLHDETWLRESEIELNPNKVGNVSLKVREVYEWLIENYLLSDFTEHDFNKICQMAQDFSLDQVKHEARQIKETDKRNVAYLYAILENKAQIAKLARNEQDKERNIYRQKIQQLYATAHEAETKLPMRGGTALAEPARTRAYAEAIRHADDDNV